MVARKRVGWVPGLPGTHQRVGWGIGPPVTHQGPFAQPCLERGVMGPEKTGTSPTTLRQPAADMLMPAVS